jgi:hypothetical protein
MSNQATIVENLIVPHRAFTDAAKQIEQCYKFAEAKAEAEGLAIIGESRTGKTSVLQQFACKHERVHTPDGWRVPVLFTSVPSRPTVKSLAEALLHAIGTPDPGRGTENDKTRRLQVLMRETGTRMVMIDEFQHFVDQGTDRVIHHVADWLKRLIDDTRATIIISGVPSCMAVMDQNAQLAGRFSAPIVMPRFDWDKPTDREQFRAIVRGFYKGVSKDFVLPDLTDNQMDFRFYVATGGLVGYLVRLLKQALRNSTDSGDFTLTMNDLHVAHMQAIWAMHGNTSLPTPFDGSFKAGPNSEVLRVLREVGTAKEPMPSAHRRSIRTRAPHVSDLLVAR